MGVPLRAYANAARKFPAERTGSVGVRIVGMHEAAERARSVVE
jgi:hypothetical protein